jgi:MGT family glycosyltransferase
VETFDDRFVFIGPSVTRTEVDTLEWPDGDGPVVYVSLGTLFHDNAAFYRACFDAFRGEPYRAIISIGAAVSVDNLGAPPSNVSVHTRVPQLQVLARAAAFVTHGGMNSVSEGLWYGVPLVVIPQMSEQLIVGRRVEDLGAGLFLTNKEATADAIRASVRRVLAENTYRRAAVTIGDSFRAAGGVSLAVDRIEMLVRTGAERVST